MHVISNRPGGTKKNYAKAKPCVFHNAPQPQARTQTFEKGGAQPTGADPGFQERGGRIREKGYTMKPSNTYSI